MSKIVAIYKPKGPTSNDVLKMVKKAVNLKKVGHAGTLDPLASGVLVVGIGREATRQLGKIVGQEKEYIAKIKLGFNSTTDDEEGEKTKINIGAKLPKNDIEKVLENFSGKISQIPPIYSAIKIKGQEAYKLARKGKDVQLKPRQVEIKEMEIIKYKWPYLEIRIVTSSGFYVRSLARDIGKELKTGGYLTELKRTRVGDFTSQKALPITKLKKLAG